MGSKKKMFQQWIFTKKPCQRIWQLNRLLTYT